MADECAYLEYRPLADESGEAGSRSGESDEREPRAYCTAADRFVQAMRADVCNRRYGLDPETDCEFYREAEGLPVVSEGEGAKGGGERAEDAGDTRTDAGDTQTDAGGD